MLESTKQALVHLNFFLQGDIASLGQYLVPLLIFAIFYFLLFLPMQRQKKQQQQMLAGLQNGTTVVTSGGLIGTIISVNPDDTLVLRIKPDNLKVLVTRGSVSGLVSEQTKS